MAYPYNSGDERKQKATIEHIFQPDASDLASTASTAAAADATSEADRLQAPWAVGWQMNERNIMWNDALKLSPDQGDNHACDVPLQPAHIPQLPAGLEHVVW